MLTIILVLIQIYAEFNGVSWGDKLMPVTIAMVLLSAWKRRREFIC